MTTKNSSINNDIIDVQVAPYLTSIISSEKVAAPILDNSYEANYKKPRRKVEPITKAEHIDLIKRYLLAAHGRGNSNIRNYTYFVLSLNFARRGGDMVGLRVCDVLNEDGSFKKHVVMREQKTGVGSEIPILRPCIEALTMYFNTIGSYKMSDWLFPNVKKTAEHISVDGMRIMLKRTVATLGLDIRIGTHSLRKTFAYWAIKNARSVEDEVMVSQYLRHYNLKTTYHYIGRSQQELDDFVAANAL